MESSAKSSVRETLGREGESAAASLYARRGFSVVARNWRSAAGELDLILTRGPLVVFCEVKTRSGTSLGGGYEAVTARKRRKLRQLAELFLSVNGVRAGAVRFDVASVELRPGAAASVELFEDAF
jgi:putative endonuclease